MKTLEDSLDHIKDLYVLESKKNKMSLSTNVSVAYEIPGFNSKVCKDFDYIRSLFNKPALKSVSLLYRAS